MSGSEAARAPHWVVIGAGWSGLACAIELVRRGRPPIVLDAAPQAGGRARAVGHTWNDATAHALDNGQHLLLGAYAQTLALMSTVGVDADRALQRLGFALAYPDGWRLGAANRPPARCQGAGRRADCRWRSASRWPAGSRNRQPGVGASPATLLPRRSSRSWRR